MVPRGRFELPRAFAHHPLKMACLPIPPPRLGAHEKPRFPRPTRFSFWQGRQDSNPRPAVLETAALAKLSYAPEAALIISKIPLGRLERPTRGLGNRCSIHLSYRGTPLPQPSCLRSLMVEIGGFEPPTPAMRTQCSPS
jgi:hypothetical protein